MIEVIITGGTIAKRYDEISGELLFDADHVQKMLSQARVTQYLKITTLFLKDSLDMDAEDRVQIAQAIAQSSTSKILVLHGTDTMVQSAQAVDQIADKRIVFTGAMIPFAFKNSDALFNLGTAFGALASDKAGVFIAMNGKVFAGDRVQKDRKMGKFVAVD